MFNSPCSIGGSCTLEWYRLRCHSEYLKSSHFPHTLVLHQGFRPGVWPLRQASDGRHPTVIPMIRA
jgi:hypothetical protein